MGPSETTSAPLSVLVVDAHADCADSLADLLRLFGHRVAVAPCGAAALTAAAADPPDVVLMELRVPDRNGWEVAGQLQDVEPGGKRPLVVAVTTAGSETDRRRSAEVGIAFHLVKPVEPDTLFQMLAGYARSLARGDRPTVYFPDLADECHCANGCRHADRTNTRPG